MQKGSDVAALASAWIDSGAVVEKIYIPKYYGLTVAKQLEDLQSTHDLYTVRDLVDQGSITVSTGHEVGKAAYGTGDIPFVRTSDIANWEIKAAPKQGVSQEIYDAYAPRQNVRVGDILFVRDGTYLIGRNCFITDVDRDIVLQSHVLKIQVLPHSPLSPELLFLAFNAPIVQTQVRSKQFTADIIDTLGSRFYELVIPIPKSAQIRANLGAETANALAVRSHGKALIQHMPDLIEEVLETGDSSRLTKFVDLNSSERSKLLTQRAVTSEFGQFTHFWRQSDVVNGMIYLPKYYDVNIAAELASLEETCELRTIGELIDSGELEVTSGDEPGKAVYGTGDIPFLRTSDFTNWEVAGDPKQGVSESVYDEYAQKQSLQNLDVLLVRDGTYLVGSSCIVTHHDAKALFCGGLLRFRVTGGTLSPYLLLALLNSYIVKRQLRSKQFTRDVIDTLGLRYREVILPVPNSIAVRTALADAVEQTVQSRIEARQTIRRLSDELAPVA